MMQIRCLRYTLSYSMCRIPNKHSPIRNIRQNNTARTNHTIRPNVHAGQHQTASPHESATAHLYVTEQRRIRSEVRTRPNMSSMSYHCIGIDNRISSNSNTGTDVGTRINSSPFFNNRPARNKRFGAYERR